MSDDKREPTCRELLNQLHGGIPLSSEDGSLLAAVMYRAYLKLHLAIANAFSQTTPDALLAELIRLRADSQNLFKAQMEQLPLEVLGKHNPLLPEQQALWRKAQETIQSLADPQGDD